MACHMHPWEIDFEHKIASSSYNPIGRNCSAQLKSLQVASVNYVQQNDVLAVVLCCSLLTGFHAIIEIC